MKEEEQDEEKYQRVGVSLYKIVKRPLLSGDFIEERRAWNYETLRQDHSKDYISRLEKFDGFCSVPEHINYKRSIGKFLNQYEPINYQPIEGECTKIIEFLSHIFEEQIEMGLDYLQLLYRKPLVRLPILILLSKERNTGKTTFLNFLKAIFASNMTFNTNEDFRSQFNSDWNNKLIIAVDEALLDRREDSERIKNLSTAMSFKAESKGKDRNEVDFFAKFILNSNNEYRPVIIDEGETRYWVRKISPLKKENNRILNDLKAEIPHFLYYLLQRDYSTKYESRMWFRHDLLITDALRKIIQFNRGSVEIEMLNLISEIMQIKELDTYSFCVNDMLRMLKQISIKAEPTQIRRILQDNWSIVPGSVTRYTAYLFDENSLILEIKKTARVYCISRDQVDKTMLLC
jgi:hypothetical protein